MFAKSLSPTLYIGAVAPESLRVEVDQGDDDFDLSTVTAATIEVGKPSSVRASWPASILAQSSTQLLVEHQFALSDLDELGEWSAHVKMTVLSGVVRAVPFVVKVKDPFAIASC